MPQTGFAATAALPPTGARHYGAPMTGITDVWAFYESLSEGPRDQLSARERVVAAICDWRQEVNSGGFDTYFRYWGGNTAREALVGLAGALGHDWAECLRDAMAVFGASYPEDPAEREAHLDDLEIDQTLAALDDRFYELEASVDADARLAAYLTEGGS
jgi:hypothetical protein